ncbi:MAG TPA: LysR family transcriptional regulator [Woeseiaceae bacterium]|nr:LysR family transcriptional regulator [Woeseiaceae bacterium]
MEQIGIDRLTGLIAFSRAASLGSYTAAARALSISPSAVSKSIQRLEERLGLKLFARTTRSLTLTPEGRGLHDRAIRLLRAAEEIELVAASVRGEPSGSIKLAAPVPIALHILAPKLALFCERYPKVTVDLRVSDTMSDLIQEGIDVAIRIGNPEDSRLIARRLGPNRAGAFASPAYLAKRGVPCRIEDLEGHDCVNIRHPNSGQLLRWPFQVGNRTVEIVPTARVVVDNSDAVTAAVAGGAGIGLSPTYVAASHVARGELVPVLAPYWAARHSITALWSESRRGNPNVKAFIAFLQEIFPNPAPWDRIQGLEGAPTLDGR